MEGIKKKTYFVEPRLLSCHTDFLIGD
jgi:hypothetical protein